MSLLAGPEFLAVVGMVAAAPPTSPPPTEPPAPPTTINVVVAGVSELTADPRVAFVAGVTAMVLGLIVWLQVIR